MMNKKSLLMTVLLVMVVCLAGISAGADYVMIDTSGASPFLYEDRSYVPLKSTASFLGAPLRWDTAKGQAVLTFNGKDLALTPGNTQAIFDGQPVVLASPPVVVRGRTYVSTEAFKKYYNIPMTWDRTRSEMRMKGPGGWGMMKVSRHAPWHGGPPPWAPAWGQRGYHKGEWKSHGKAGAPSAGKHPAQHKQNGKSQGKGQ